MRMLYTPAATILWEALLQLSLTEIRPSSSGQKSGTSNHGADPQHSIQKVSMRRQGFWVIGQNVIDPLASFQDKLHEDRKKTRLVGSVPESLEEWEDV